MPEGYQNIAPSASRRKPLSATAERDPGACPGIFPCRDTVVCLLRNAVCGERLSPSVFTGGAAYPITKRTLLTGKLIVINQKFCRKIKSVSQFANHFYCQFTFTIKHFRNSAFSAKFVN